jgi:hypothetical protein
MLNVTWSKKDSGRWHPFGVFGGLDLDDEQFDRLVGVYCIFSTSTRFVPNASPPILPKDRTIFVGSGSIRKCLKAHRVERAIKRHGPQSVTWVHVPKAQQAGVVAFLMDELHPLEGERSPEVERIPVNLPYPPPEKQREASKTPRAW